MKIIIGVSFRQAGKVYFFDPGDEQIERGEPRNCRDCKRC